MASFVSVNTILEAAAAAFDVEPRALRTPRRGGLQVIQARKAACLLARDLTDQTYEQVGRSIGMRDHTTILHAVRAAEAKSVSDPDFAMRMAAARTAIRLVSQSELSRLLADPDAVAIAHRLCADPVREATRVSTLETLALAVRLLSLEDLAGGSFVLLAKIAAAPAGSDLAALREQHAALIEAMAETLASLGYADPEAKPEEAKETLHV